MIEPTLNLHQMLIFEINSGCNLATAHAGKCPISDPHRWDNLDATRPLTDDVICQSVHTAYNKLGFRGYVAWHFYNEPCSNWPRLRALMQRIKMETPQARFYVFTNGELLPHDREQIEIIDALWISNYCGQDWSDVTAWHPQIVVHHKPPLDDRLVIRPDQSRRRCLRPFTEIVCDYYGNFHICCFDWQGKVKLPNIWDVGYEAAVAEYVKIQNVLSHNPMSADAPAFCRVCRWRNDACPIVTKIWRDMLEHFDGENRIVGESDSTERTWICHNFAGRKGRFLDIGAYDGLTESMTAHLIRAGWEGVLVEPAPQHFYKMMVQYGNCPQLKMINAAVTASGGVRPFMLEMRGGQGNTLVPELADYFTRKHGNDYQTYHLNTLSMASLLDNIGGPKNLNFVSIDAEGVNLELLRSLPLADMTDTEVIVVERETDVKLFQAVLEPYYNIMATTPINIIAKRKEGV